MMHRIGSKPLDRYRFKQRFADDRVLGHPRMPAATCALGILLFLSLAAGACGWSEAGPPVAPVQASTVQSITPFHWRDSLVLAYELRITDFRTSGLELDKIVVRANQCDGKQLIEYRGETLEEIVKEPRDAFFISEAISDFVSLLWIKFPLEKAAPTRLCNTLLFNTPSSEHLTVNAYTDIHRKTQLQLSPPLRGGPWLAANGPANNDFHHRHTVFAKGNEYYLGERFAVDWMKLSENGSGFRGEGQQNEDFPSYGEDILAVADAVVVDIIDGIPDNIPFAAPIIEITEETVGGNLVLLEIDEGIFVLYAHFIPDTITVLPGEKVTTGQVLGKLGNSGNSDVPHLHFQVSNGTSPLFSQGLPYHISRYVVQADLGSEWIGLYEGETTTNRLSIPYSFQLPANGQIVEF